MTPIPGAKKFRGLLRKIGLGHLTHPRIGRPVLKNVAICMIRNEQDVIEPFLRHHSALFDLIVVLDNRSTDRSREIITALVRELGNIVVTDLPEPAYKQSETMTAALHYVQATVFADFVFFLDADEFLDAHTQSDLLAALAGVSPGTVGLLPWRTFVPDATLSEADFPDPLDRLTLVRSEEAPQYYKAVLRMGGGVDPSLKVEQGNHAIQNAKGEKLSSTVVWDVALLHFPLRSKDQLLAKGVIGWEANKQRTRGHADPCEGFQWKTLSEMHESGTLVTEQTVMETAIAYAQTPKPGALSDCVQVANHGIRVARTLSDGTSAPAQELIAASRDMGAVMTPPLPLPASPHDPSAKTDVAHAFTSEWHWDHLFLDEPMIRFVLERFAPQSVLDLGCGSGLYPKLYAHLGVTDILGVDGLELAATILDDSNYQKADLQVPFDAGRKFDLVVCLEVVEHIDPKATAILFDSIEHHAASHILFSMAEPGQPGNGHINCKHISEVLDLWASRGWQPDLAATLSMRAVSTMSWFRRNILALIKTGETGESEASRALKVIGDLPYAWYGQSTGQRVAAFAEPYPAAHYAYDLVLPAQKA